MVLLSPMATCLRVLTSILFVLLLFIESDGATDKKDCVKWGGQFDVPLRSKNVVRDCKLPDGRAVCCAATPEGDEFSSRGVGYSYDPPYPIKREPKGTACTISRTYTSSPQELRELQMSHELQAISDPAKRLDMLMKYVTSDSMMNNATRWLARVSAHMKSEHGASPLTKDDYEYLSRWTVTKTCSNGGKTQWIEWIEPVNIAARHPFAFSRCKHTWQYFKGKPDTQRADRSDVDYVLLQSGVALYNASLPFSKQQSQSSPRISPRRSNKHYFLDAGTSTFDSSLFWFTCAFTQRRISFNDVYGWEMTLLDPLDYWKRVPARWKPHWHFYNTPISPEPSHADSPVRLLKQLARVEDFVAFKLDIDHPDTEMPIALSLLSDPSFSSLIDEFFFELHFQCEVMTSCGWGKRVPPQSHGLTLDRPHVLQFFIDLRKKGIRAHIWP